MPQKVGSGKILPVRRVNVTKSIHDMIQYVSWIFGRLSKCQLLQDIKTELCPILRVLSPKITSEHDPRYTCHKNGAVPPPIMVQWTWPMLCNQVARQRPSTHVLHLPRGILLVGCLCPNMYPKHTHVALSHQKAWWNMLVLDETWLQTSCWYLASEIMLPGKYQHFVQYMQAATRTNQSARFSDMCYIIRQTTWHKRMKPLMLNPDSQPNLHILKHIFYKDHMESGQS